MVYHDERQFVRDFQHKKLQMENSRPFDEVAVLVAKPKMMLKAG